MKVKLNEIVEVELIMTVKEALWLKAIMQNPLCGQSSKEESSEDAEMRYSFFNAIDLDAIKIN